LNKLVLRTIPSDPAATIYRQGSTLGAGYKHWFRAKFGNGWFRLFFRYDANAKIITFAWINVEATLRTYGAKTDAYKVFKGMLDNGNPPDDWASLHKAASRPKIRDQRADERQQRKMR
jgi:toxin YhaV